MCGLTGVVVNPNHASYDKQRELVACVLSDLLERTVRRGSHATGVASLSSRGSRIAKRAMPAPQFVKTPEFVQWLDSAQDERASVLLGHTRHATHHNAHLDHAAHPFQAERVVGAHNGIIHNWREVEARVKADRVKGKRKLFGKFEVDSEAAFAALDTYKKPNEALALLRGYFALTWMRGGSFFVARTPDAPLTCVYVPEYRALFYNSERETLLATLKTWGVPVDKANVYDPTPGNIYRYVPTQFGASETSVQKIGTWTCVDRAPRGFDSSKPQSVASANTRTVPTKGGIIQPSWTEQDADEHFLRRLDKANGGVRVRERLDDLDAVHSRSLRERVYALEGENTRLRALLAKLDRKVTALADARLVDDNAHVPTQAELDLNIFASGGTCAVCGFGATQTRPLTLVDDKLVHANCESALCSLAESNGWE